MKNKVRYLKVLSGGHGLIDKTLYFRPVDEPGILMGTEAKSLTYTQACGPSRKVIGVFANYTGITGEWKAIFSDTTYTPTTTDGGLASVMAIQGKLTISAGTEIKVAAPGQYSLLAGVDGRLTNLGTLNGDGVWVCGIRGCVWGGGTNTKARFIAAVLAMPQLSADLGTGLYCAFMALATVAPNPHAVLGVEGAFDNFLDIQNIQTAFEVNGTEKGTTTIGWLKVMTAGAVQGYINVYTE